MNYNRRHTYIGNTMPPISEAVQKKLIVVYNIFNLVSKALKVKYNITVGKSLMVKYNLNGSDVTRAFWESPDKSNPSEHTQ